MRYLIFAGQDYYPIGGAEDFRDSSDDLPEALESAKNQKYDSSNRSSDWAHVWDSKEQKLVAHFSDGVRT